MNIDEKFPSKYLKAPDLKGREVKVIMANAEMETVGKDEGLVLYFKGKDRGLVVNKTNRDVIKAAYGAETEDWFDQPLILFSVMVDFQGKVGPAIRCRVPTAKDNPKPARKADPITSGPQHEDASDFPGDRPFNDPIDF